MRFDALVLMLLLLLSWLGLTPNSETVSPDLLLGRAAVEDRYCKGTFGERGAAGPVEFFPPNVRVKRLTPSIDFRAAVSSKLLLEGVEGSPGAEDWEAGEDGSMERTGCSTPFSVGARRWKNGIPEGVRRGLSRLERDLPGLVVTKEGADFAASVLTSPLPAREPVLDLELM